MNRPSGVRQTQIQKYDLKLENSFDNFSVNQRLENAETMTRSVSKSDSVSHEYANNRCFRRSVCRLWSLFQVAVLLGVLKYFALIRNRDYFSVRVANVILDEPLLQGSLSRVAKNITQFLIGNITKFLKF